MNKSEIFKTAGAKSAAPASAASRLGPGMSLKGGLTGSGDLIIEGRFEGTISLPDSSLTVAPEAQVAADIVAANVEVSGMLSGDVKASGRILIEAQAKMDGNLAAARVAIRDGAQFKGSIKIIHSDA